VKKILKFLTLISFLILPIGNAKAIPRWVHIAGGAGACGISFLFYLNSLDNLRRLSKHLAHVETLLEQKRDRRGLEEFLKTLKDKMGRERIVKFLSVAGMLAGGGYAAVHTGLAIRDAVKKKDDEEEKKKRFDWATGKVTPKLIRRTLLKLEVGPGGAKSLTTVNGFTVTVSRHDKVDPVACKVLYFSLDCEDRDSDSIGGGERTNFVFEITKESQKKGSQTLDTFVVNVRKGLFERKSVVWGGFSKACNVILSGLRSRTLDIKDAEMSIETTYVPRWKPEDHLQEDRHRFDYESFEDSDGGEDEDLDDDEEGLSGGEDEFLDEEEEEEEYEGEGDD